MRDFFRSKPFKRARALTLSCFAVFLVIGLFIGVWYGTASAPTEIDAAPASLQLKLDESTSVDNIIKNISYNPFWIKAESINATVSVLDHHNAPVIETTGGVLRFDEKAKTFTATGIGSGFITFTSPIDKTVSLIVPFEVSFASKDVSAILTRNYPSLMADSMLTESEIASITTIDVGVDQADLSDLVKFDNLTTLHLPCEKSVPALSNIKTAGAWDYYVPASKYDEVVSAAGWAEHKNYVFPETDIADGYFTVIFAPEGGEFKKGTSMFDASALKSKLYVLETDGKSALKASDFELTKKGFTFNGWVIDGDGAVDGQKYMPDNYEVKGNTKAHADWTEHQYSIEFDANGGTGKVAGRTLKYSESYLPATIMQRKGYDFMGWSTSPSGKVVVAAGEPIVSLTDQDTTETITLYAIWREDVYNVEFHDGAEKIGELKNIKYGDAFNIIKYEPKAVVGQTFLGWDTNPSATSPKYAKLQSVSGLTEENGSTVIIYAIWDANRYTVKYDANGGSNPPAAQTLKYNQTGYITASQPTRYGFAFAGWAKTSYASKAVYDAGDSFINLSSENGAVVTLYAVWKPDTFKVIFNSTGATSGSAVTKTVEFGDSYTMNITQIKRTGYGIAGWATTSGSSTVEYRPDRFSEAEVKELYEVALTNSTKTINLYPVWKELTYYVEFDVNGGSVSGADTKQLGYYNTFTLPGGSKDNGYYTLSGWESDFDGHVYSAGTTLSGDDFDGIEIGDTVTFEAVWKLVKYDVTFALDGGTGSSAHNAKTGISVSSTFSLPTAPTKSGYNFKGWKCNADNKIYSAGQSYSNSSKQSVKFTAQWESIAPDP